MEFFILGFFAAALLYFVVPRVLPTNKKRKASLDEALISVCIGKQELVRMTLQQIKDHRELFGNNQSSMIMTPAAFQHGPLIVSLHIGANCYEIIRAAGDNSDGNPASSGTAASELKKPPQA